MAGSLENRGKLRELIDKFQFIWQHNIKSIALCGAFFISKIRR